VVSNAPCVCSRDGKFRTTANVFARRNFDSKSVTSRYGKAQVIYIKDIFLEALNLAANEEIGNIDEVQLDERKHAYTDNVHDSLPDIAQNIRRTEEFNCGQENSNF
jgi:hypothetical protein